MKSFQMVFTDIPIPVASSAHFSNCTGVNNPVMHLKEYFYLHRKFYTNNANASEYKERCMLLIRRKSLKAIV